MPIYEYVCRNCGHELERLQKVSDPPLSDCPECSEASLVRKISAAGFRLKGGGWYETDFKSDKRRNVAESGDGKKTESDSGKSGSGAEKSESTGSKGEKGAGASSGPAPGKSTGD